MRAIGFKQITTISLLCLASIFLQNTQAHDDNKIIRLCATTSTTASGLLDILLPPFQRETGYRVEVEAFGSGRALRRARDGKADVIIVHSPAAEQKLMDDGHGNKRLPLMKNEFIIAGPATDPAGVASSADAVNAFKAIARKKTRFVSRGDDSGTHVRELEIWSMSNIEPFGRWYIEYGHGMGKTLVFADRMNAYVLVDKSTWLAKRAQLKLALLLEDDALLANPYHVISINADRHPSVNQAGAQRLIEWMTSKQGQDIIRGFTVDGETLFAPANLQ